MRHIAAIISAWAVAATLALSGGPAAAQARGAERPCVAGQPSLTVEVRGFKNAAGLVRAQLYGPGPAGFLDKGRWAMRKEERLKAGVGAMRFCFPIERPGRYAVAVRHDANDSGKSDWNDGGGFTGNPHLSVFHLKPAFEAAAVSVGDRPVTATVVMQYRSGLSIAPVGR